MGEFRILLKMVLPLSLPIIATIGLLVGVAYWNDWFNALLYINEEELYSLQVLLSKICRTPSSWRPTYRSEETLREAAGTFRLLRCVWPLRW